MRSFRTTFRWETEDETIKIVLSFAPEFENVLTVDEFYSMMSGCVSSIFTSCSAEAQSYMKDSLLMDVLPEYPLSACVVQTVEEIYA